MADKSYRDNEGSRSKKAVPDATAVGAAGDQGKQSQDTSRRSPTTPSRQAKADGRGAAARSREDKPKSHLRSSGTTLDQSRDANSSCDDVTGAASDVRAESRAGSAASRCSRPGSAPSRVSEFSLSDAEYMALILNDSLQLLKDLAHWRKIYQLDDDVIAENAEKILAGDFHHLYSDLSPSQQATVRVSLERMRQMPEAELLKSLDTFPVRAPVA